MLCRPKLAHGGRVRKPDRSRLSLERLESRLVMDSAATALMGDNFDVRQNGPEQPLDVLHNDFFDASYSGERKITAVSYGSEGGRVEIASDGRSILYAPPADFSGNESFVYFVDNDLSATAHVAIYSPVTSDVYNLTPDLSQYRLHVAANDPFWEGYTGARRISSVSTSQLGGDVRIAEDGISVYYSLPDEVFKQDTFVYVVDDRYPATVTINVEQGVYQDYFEIIQNTASPLYVLVNDLFWRSYPGRREITFVSESTFKADIAIAENRRSLLYSPPKDFFGTDDFTYVVDGRYEGKVHVSVRRPTKDDFGDVDIGSVGFLLDVTRNDYYTDRNSVKYDIVERVTSVTDSTSGGRVEITEDGQGIRYSPPTGFSGNDSFEYVADGKYPATVWINVTRPIRDDFFTTYEDTVNNVLKVQANDFLGNGYLGERRITSVSESAAGGTVAISEDARKIFFSPKPGFIGRDSFRYTTDNDLEAIVSVWVDHLAMSDSLDFCPAPEASHSLFVLENDHFDKHYPGAGLITSVEELTDGGRVSIADDGRSLLFEPQDGARTHIRYTVDGKYQANVFVQIHSELSNDEFTVDQNSSANPLDVLKNDSQSQYSHSYFKAKCGVYNGPKRITSAGPSKAGGTLHVASDGSAITYSPPPDFHGTDTITYAVDGVMQATAQIHVIRRVRDDRFHVDPGSTNNALPVLINDLFGADYLGPRKITGVTSTASGGVATISSDQQSISYSPPATFSGTDSFTYTVDGALKATVQVDVNASLADQFPRFSSQDAFQQMLINDALTAHAASFGAKTYPGWRDAATDAIGLNSPSESSRTHSDTNVQVAGVDEADLIENDGQYLYSIVDRRLAISRAWPADQLTVVSETRLDEQPIGLYLLGNRLTVVGREYTPAIRGGSIEDLQIWQPSYYSPQTVVTVFDVSDRSLPRLVQKTRIDGQYAESRRIGNFVYVVSNQRNISLPNLNTVCQDVPTATDSSTSMVRPDCRYETKEEYLNRVQDTFGELLGNALPHFESFSADGQFVRSGLLHVPEEIFKPIWSGDRVLMSVVSLDVTNDEPGLASTAGLFTSWGAVVYGSLDSLYVSSLRYDKEETKTGIIKFDWDARTGSIALAATGIVSGSVVDQFSLDEYEGNLRIATTVNNYGSGNYSRRDENLLFVFVDDGGVLELIGGMQNTGLGETIRSVRFMGQRAFVTTFRDRDPLFAIDLSNPVHPRWVGHLTMPGFSSYLQFIDGNHILGVGRNTAGTSGPTQVALFDVTDLQRPVLIDQYTFARFSTSEAEQDHHAFGWFSQHNVLAVPMSRVFWSRTDENGDGYRETRTPVEQYELVMFRIDVTPTSRSEHGIQRIGAVAHDRPVRRSAFIDDVLYSVAEDSIKAVDIQTPAIEHGAAIFSDEEQDPSDPPVRGDHIAIRKAVNRARQDLAKRLGVEAGELLPLTADHASADEPFKVVLRNGPRQFLYSLEGDTLELIGEDFQFLQITNFPQCNLEQPLDTNDDGIISPLDVLQVIHRLNDQSQRSDSRNVVRQIDAVTADGDVSSIFADANHDGYLTPIDALLVINHLNSLVNASSAEGEGAIVDSGAVVPNTQSAQVSALRDQESANVESFPQPAITLPSASNIARPIQRDFRSTASYAAIVDLLLRDDVSLAR